MIIYALLLFRIKGNTRTHFLDCSNIYGSLPDTARSLRELKNGKLKINSKQILPQAPNNGSCDYECYYSGSLFSFPSLST